jgi:hypothetical protein
MMIFESPVPIFCGFNKEFKFLLNKKFDVHYENTIFFDLDNQQIFNYNIGIFKYDIFQKLSMELEILFI